jgi:hypothetical protein
MGGRLYATGQFNAMPPWKIATVKLFCRANGDGGNGLGSRASAMPQGAVGQAVGRSTAELRSCASARVGHSPQNFGETALVYEIAGVQRIKALRLRHGFLRPFT